VSCTAEQQQHWYYAEGDKSVGPISLADLIMILSRLSEAQSVLVWRGGLSDWVQAKDLPELAPYVTKPPPQPVSRSTFEQLLAAAQRGDARSQYELAGVYYNGDGVARNPVQGGQWLLNAAEAGYVPAQCDLGEIASVSCCGPVWASSARRARSASAPALCSASSRK
jgi:TPR repeat protein